MNANLAPFLDPALVVSYAEETPKKVPGFADLHRMTAILLAEQAPDDGQILVVGAGGGLELVALAEARPGWRFTGVDPSPAMLAIASQKTAPIADRVKLLEGTIDAAPLGPFDGATCLLTLHFLHRDERLRTLSEIRRRMRAGATLVIAHHTAPDGSMERWLARSAAFAGRSDSSAEIALASASAMAERLPLMSPSEEEGLMRAAGFVEPALFYAGFSFRGWVALAG